MSTVLTELYRRTGARTDNELMDLLQIEHGVVSDCAVFLADVPESEQVRALDILRGRAVGGLL